MRLLAVKWTFVFLISELCHGVTTLKPTLEPAKDELIIQEGNELRLGCHGKGRLRFTTQTYISNTNGSEFEIWTDEKSGNITFIRQRTVKEDTGWYACAEEGVYVWNDERNTDHVSNDIAWIYVFVNSSKPFVVDTVYESLTALAGEELVVPCRVTSPDLPVMAEINFGMAKLPANKYDPKIGFILEKAVKTLSQQTFECKVNGSEKSLSYTLKVINPGPLKCPNITLGKTSHVIRGRNLSMDCEIDVPYGTKLFNMSWQVPKSVPEKRLSIVAPKIVGDTGLYRTWKTELRIENFRESYDGEYYCKADSNLGNQNTSMEIKSLVPEYTYIDARVNGNPNIVGNESMSAQWRIEMASYPEEVDWKWYDEHDEVILEKGGNESAKYSHDQNPGYDIFRINNLSVSDNGNYTIEFSNKQNGTVVNLKLTVRAQPSVWIDKLAPYYSPGEFADFICHSYGKPLPNISWFIKEYPNITSKESLDVRPLPNPTTKLGPKGDYHAVSTINVEINHGADLICESCNEIMCVKSIERIVAGKPQSNILWISVVCVLVFIIVVIAYLGIRSWRRLQKQLDRFERGDPERLDLTKNVDDQAKLLPYDMKWEVRRDKLKLGQELGRGAFGIVKKAEARDISGQGEVTIAAVKMVQKDTGTDMEGLIRELKIMIHVGRHPNVVNLLGACTRRIYSGDELYVIVEYCCHGNLQSYLKNHSNRCNNRINPPDGEVCFHYSALNGAAGNNVGVGNQTHAYVQHGALENIVVNPNHQSIDQSDDWKPIHTKDLLDWARQVSEGMDYLSSKNVLHRDLATRNILLADNNAVKICDFGLAKNVYQDVNYMAKSDTMLPVKWMAVESIVDSLFSTQSDVWSFGIVLWEFFTLADTPYWGIEPPDQHRKLLEGYRMEKPEHATDEIYKIMRDCWKTFPKERPTFSELAKRFNALINGSPSAVSHVPIPAKDRPYVSIKNGVLNNRQSDDPTSKSRSRPELPSLDVNINVDVSEESSPLQMSSPTISDFEYSTEYPGTIDMEDFERQQAETSEESCDENLPGRDSGYSSFATVSPPPNLTEHPSIRFHRNSSHPEGETIDVSPAEIHYRNSSQSDSEDCSEYVAMLDAGSLGSSGPVGKVSGYCSIAMIPAPSETTNQSSETVTYVPMIQNGNSASKLVSKQSNYVARPDGV